MRSYILYLIIVKFLSGIGEITSSTNTSTNISSTIPTSIPANIISCYSSCGFTLQLPIADTVYNLLDNPSCINTTYNKIKKIDVNKKSCAINIIDKNSLSTDKTKTNENFFIIHYTTMDNENCQTAKKFKTNTVCLHSTCDFLSVCCEQDLCNTVKKFNLQWLNIYAAPSKDKKLITSYSKYTDRKCKIDLKNKNIKKIQPCIVSYQSASNYSHTINNAITAAYNIKTTPTNISYTINLGLPKYLLISFIIILL